MNSFDISSVRLMKYATALSLGFCALILCSLLRPTPESLAQMVSEEIPNTPTPTVTAAPTNTPILTPTSTPDPTTQTWNPSSCVFRSADQVQYKGSVYNHSAGYGRCPSNFAAVTTSNGAAYSFICCPLPSSDILTGAVTSRTNSCGANELMVGSDYSDKSTATIQCQAINTAKYKLGAASTSCVWGSGVAGWAGAGNCGANPPIIGANNINGSFDSVGTDGCSGSPFGRFAVGRTSPNCGDQKFAQLQDQNGSPVLLNYP